MGTHHAPHRPDGLGGLVGRGALTAVAALALAGGGAGVAFAGDGPTGADQDASHSADHGDDCSWMSFGSDDDQDGPDSGSGTDDGDRADSGNRGDSGDRGSGTTHRRPTRSNAPSTENIARGAAQGGATTVPIRSGVMR